MEQALVESLFEEKIISHTKSLCPDCEYPEHVKTLDAELFEKDGMVMIRKECPEHGEFTDVVWSSKEMWDRAERYARKGRGIENPFITKYNPECPDDCGLCYQHQSHPALVNMVVTNRCDLACWYCFFFADKVGYVYEPDLDQVRKMVRAVRGVRPIPGNAIQLTGGEPTLREDLEEIVKIIREEGIEHIQLNTDGINLSTKPDLARRMRDAGVKTVYLSFDGVTPKTNPKNYYEIPGAIENCRDADLGIVFVPTVIKTINDHEVGSILRYAQKNIDIVRGIIYQPVSLTGRMTRKDRETFRITIPDVIRRIEEQTDGEVASSDFYPVPAVATISDFIGTLSGKRYELTSHFACGMATYVFRDGDRLIPLPRFVDIDGLFEYMNEKSGEIVAGKSANRVKLEFISHLALGKLGDFVGIESFIDTAKAPKYLNVKNLISNALFHPGYDTLAEFHKNSMLIGMMHFQDKSNYMVDRTEQCCIHYSLPNGALIPFCAFNVIPEKYRDALQKQYGTPLDEWNRNNQSKIVKLYRTPEELKTKCAMRLI